MLLIAVAFAQSSAELTPPDARFALALYCNPTCSDAVLDQLETDLGGIRGRSGFPDQVTKPGRIMGMSDTSFGIPDADFVEAYGIDVDRPEQLAQSQQVVLAWFAAPAAQAVEVLAIAHAAFGKAAEASGGWVEDLDTQSLYGASAWKALDPGGPITGWVVVDGAPMGEDTENAPLRMVTRGLRRFGLPELVVTDVDPVAAGDVAVVLNAVATSMAENGPPSAQNVFVQVTTFDGAQVKGTASFVRIAREEEDPDDPLLKLSFDGEIVVMPDSAILAEPEEAPVETLPAEPVASVNTPPVEPIIETPIAPIAAPVAAPANLQEAQALARDRIESVVKPSFLGGLPRGEVVAVSLPFEASDGSLEYMWVEITSWNGTSMTGVLANDPRNIAELKKGDTVRFEQSEIFDYIWKKADGSREGNTTAAFL